jgi:recombinational DNA repair protein RecR
MNSTSLYLLQMVIAVVTITAWLLRRPGKCSGCGARLAVKNGCCQKCGKATDGHRLSSLSQPANRGTSTKSAGFGPILYVLAVLLSIPGIGALPIASGNKFLLGLGVIVGGLVWVLIALKRDATCRSCGELTYGSYCSQCGNARRGTSD